MGREFKKCACSVEFWEVIVVDKDEHFDDRSTVYYHCDKCGEDFAVVEYDTRSILYLDEKPDGNK